MKRSASPTARSANPDDASTAGRKAAEERSEAREPKAPRAFSLGVAATVSLSEHYRLVERVIFS